MINFCTFIFIIISTINNEVFFCRIIHQIDKSFRGDGPKIRTIVIFRKGENRFFVLRELICFTSLRTRSSQGSGKIKRFSKISYYKWLVQQNYQPIITWEDWIRNTSSSLAHHETGEIIISFISCITSLVSESWWFDFVFLFFNKHLCIFREGIIGEFKGVGIFWFTCWLTRESVEERGYYWNTISFVTCLNWKDRNYCHFDPQNQNTIFDCTLKIDYWRQKRCGYFERRSCSNQFESLQRLQLFW